MEFITENGNEYILVSKQTQVDFIVDRITKREPFADQFKFSERELFLSLLEAVNVDYDQFTAKYYYYDTARKLHISESEFGHVWISSVGLVANKKTTNNRAVNSCLAQYTVVSLLFDKAIEVATDERVYDIDSYKFRLLSELSPAIYHNVVFYIEVFCKAYLSLTGTQPPHTHKLSTLYQKTVEVMTSNHHDNSLFQILVLDPLYNFIDHILKMPGDYKEHFIKYDDNDGDNTVILFELAGLYQMKDLLSLSVDFIKDYFYSGTETHYLESNLYQRMLAMADTEVKKKKLQEFYPHLAKKNKENNDPSSN